MQSWLTVASNSWGSCDPPTSASQVTEDHRCMPPHSDNFVLLFGTNGVLLFPRLVSNSWPEGVLPLHPPKMLEYRYGPLCSATNVFILIAYSRLLLQNTSFMMMVLIVHRCIFLALNLGIPILSGKDCSLITFVFPTVLKLQNNETQDWLRCFVVVVVFHKPPLAGHSSTGL